MCPARSSALSAAPVPAVRLTMQVESGRTTFDVGSCAVTLTDHTSEVARPGETLVVQPTADLHVALRLAHARLVGWPAPPTSQQTSARRK